jgi:hypothetical protein
VSVTVEKTVVCVTACSVLVAVAVRVRIEVDVLVRVADAITVVIEVTFFVDIRAGQEENDVTVDAEMVIAGRVMYDTSTDVKIMSDVTAGRVI